VCSAHALCACADGVLVYRALLCRCAETSAESAEESATAAAPEDDSALRVVPLSDPDGSRIVMLGPRQIAQIHLQREKNKEHKVCGPPGHRDKCTRILVRQLHSTRRGRVQVRTETLHKAHMAVRRWDVCVRVQLKSSSDESSRQRSMDRLRSARRQTGRARARARVMCDTR